MRDFRGQEVTVGDFLLTANGDLWQSVPTNESIWKRSRALAVVPYKVRGKPAEPKYVVHSLLIKLPLRISLEETIAMAKLDRAKLWSELAEPVSAARRAELKARRGFFHGA